ncbi:MAG: cyclopropane-fatty-acyl-phospholipid synthase [Bryobacterales bacterium]|nr:cyclopropane-fatty-acyl-phospholipid synthase [Bryobacterales bacterium]
MSEAAVPSLARPRPGSLARWLLPLAERRLKRRLQDLRGAGLTIEEGGSAHFFGDRDGLRAKVTVKSWRFWTDILLGGTLGAAESYILGRWQADDLTAVCRIFARNLDLSDGMERGWAAGASIAAKCLHALNRNTRRGVASNIKAHYDLGNDFFRLVLDETMSYSCAMFRAPDEPLEAASTRKMDLACRKLDLKPTDRLLEIGTGWGSLAIHAARQYGCSVVTTTISEQQHLLARKRVMDAALGDRIDVRRQDYRDLTGRFDKIVSIEMIEAVGHEFIPEYFALCNRLLKGDGLMLLQGILMAEHRYESYRRSADFIQRYVFPGSCLTSMATIAGALARTSDMRMIHLEDLAPHYGETLRRWKASLRAHEPEIRALGYPPGFIRLWEFYLCYCEAGFEERLIGNVQLLLAKPRNRRAPIRADTGPA